jgi:8-oxo-dGTP diphosphatase
MSTTGKYADLSVTTDIVIFSIFEDALHVLLIERGNDPFKGRWALPGGFLDEDEDLDICARRELAEETGVTDIYLEQLYTFGNVGRDPRGRVVTVAYFALVPEGRLEVEAASDAADARWFAMDKAPELAFDHQDILRCARERLISKLGYSTIAFQMMPEEFTLSALQRVYEIIGGEELDKRNFRKFILALNVLEETGRKQVQGAHRPAMLYRVAEPRTVKIVK